MVEFNFELTPDQSNFCFVTGRMRLISLKVSADMEVYISPSSLCKSDSNFLIMSVKAVPNASPCAVKVPLKFWDVCICTLPSSK